jgi:SAM-dependent methyltransferase
MDTIKHVDFWFEKPPGSLILQQETALLDDVLSAFPGDVLLQVGGPSNMTAVTSSPIAHKVYASLDGVSTDGVSSFEFDLEALPLQHESLDCVVVMHALSYVDEPASFLKKINSCLRPGGKLIVFGFNKYSLWGLARLKRDRNLYPWGGSFHPLWKVRHWVQHAGLHVLFDQNMCYRGPAVSKQKWQRRRYQEVLGSMLCPRLSGVYMLSAVKPVIPVTPTTEKRVKVKAKSFNGYVEPSIRERFK